VGFELGDVEAETRGFVPAQCLLHLWPLPLCRPAPTLMLPSIIAYCCSANQAHKATLFTW
jgi:hypothetical protein